MNLSMRKWCRCATFALVGLCFIPSSRVTVAAPRTWIGGNVDWIDGGAITNWNPNDEPDADDEAIFNAANSVNLGSNNSIQALTMSAGIDLSTNDNDLLVDGLVQLSGAGTNLFVRGATSELNADNLTTGGGGNVELAGGALVLDEEEILGAGAVTVNASGTLAGYGTVMFADSPIFSSSLLTNNGTLTALTRVSIVGELPPANALSISGGGALARIDLDGSGESGVVNVNRNQTLDINLAISDAFNGDMNMFHGSTLDMASAWSLGGGTIDIDNGAFAGIPPVPAGVSTIAGSALTQAGGTITVVDNDGTLQFNAPFTMNGGNFVNNGLVVFDANATIAAGANFTMPTNSSSITVAANRTVTFNQANFNADGAGVPTNVLTVNSSGVLTLNLGAGADELISALVKLNGGALHVNTTDNTWSIDGDIEVGANTGISQLSGEDLTLNNVNTTVGANSTLRITAPVTIAAAANFTGTGTLAFNNQATVSNATVFNMVGGTVDLDGTDATGENVNINASTTINAGTMASFGRANVSGTNTLIIDNSAGTGVLTVNLDSATAEWTLNAQGVMNFVNDNTDATLLAGNDVNVEGTINVTGDVRSVARLDITGTVNINTAAQPFRLAGGNNSDDRNTIAGGTIAGVGLLGADDGKGLRGFGTINSGIDFDGTASLRADDGILAVNGVILDAGIVGTADADATFHVTSAWNNNVTSGVQLNGGTLSGGTITNDVTDGISGRGLVTARVINNTQLFAGSGGTLIFETLGNDNEWDGTTNTGQIEAVGGNIELRDTGPASGFAGTVTAIGGQRVFANGFALDFNPGSTLILQNGTYESTSSTDIGGTVTVNAGPTSTIKVENNSFLSFETSSSTTLNANLQLQNNNIIIEQGATFSGPGALVIPDGSHVVGENQADIGVLLDMQGAFRPGNSEGLGRVNLFDYQQADTGELFVELTGTSLNAFDRLVADGDVVLDGYLNIDVDLGFVPTLGNTFNIITGNTVTGQFDFVDTQNMPDGLTFAIAYLSNAVQLQVVNTPFYSADFDDDGDVDATDLSIWRGAFNLNQLGDADGDNDSDGEDFLLWQQQFGSHPGAAAFIASVPEPTSVMLLLFGLITAASFRRNRCHPIAVNPHDRGMVSRLALIAFASSLLPLVDSNGSYAQSIDMSLNLQYTNPGDPAMGGNWTLVAKTNSANGIGSINAILSNVNAAGIAYQSGIGAMLKSGNPFVIQNGSLVELLYAQELSNPASVVTDVGRGTGTPGNLALDPLGNPAWNNAAVIATGTFGATKPAFTANLDTPPDVTKGNVLGTKTAPFFMAPAATVTTVVRDSLSVPLAGDYNLNGTVDAADYVLWRHTLSQMVTPSSGADGNGNGTIDDGDYEVWRSHFGQTAGSGTGSYHIAAVPEPATLALLILAGVGGSLGRRRTT
jgi:hypothetical protein